MTSTARVVSCVYAALLLACAFFAGFDDLAFAFSIAEGDMQVSGAIGALLIATLAGGTGLIIASFGSWTRWRMLSLLGLVSAMTVLPAAILYGWQNTHAMWINTHHSIHYRPWAWASAILPPFLDLAAIAVSWSRLQRLSVQFD